MNAEINTKLEGKFKVAVVRKDGTVSYPLGNGWKKNLILNSGKDLFFTSSSGQTGCLPQLMDYCRAGTGTTAAAVTDTALQAQVKFSNDYNTGAGNNSTTYNLGTGACTLQRTYEFASEVGTVVYGELGMSNTSAGNLFSRIVLGSTISCAVGENLRVTYALTITVSQIITGTGVSLTSGTFDTTGSLKFAGQLSRIFPIISSTGAVGPSFSVAFPSSYQSHILNGYTGTYSLGGPSQPMCAALRTASAFPAVNADISVGTTLAFIADTTNVSSTAYVVGNYYRTSTFVFLASNPGSTITTIRSIIITVNDCYGDPSANGYGIMLLFNANQTKGSDYKLTFVFKWSVSAP